MAHTCVQGPWFREDARVWGGPKTRKRVRVVRVKAGRGLGGENRERGGEREREDTHAVGS